MKDGLEKLTKMNYHILFLHTYLLFALTEKKNNSTFSKHTSLT